MDYLYNIIQQTKSRRYLDSKIAELSKIGLFPLPDKDYTTADYNIILFWSVFMNRQSKILIKEIQNYQKRFPDKKMNVLYVNTDNVYSKMEK